MLATDVENTILQRVCSIPAAATSTSRVFVLQIIEICCIPILFTFGKKNRTCQIQLEIFFWFFFCFRKKNKLKTPEIHLMWFHLGLAGKKFKIVSFERMFLVKWPNYFCKMKSKESFFHIFWKSNGIRMSFRKKYFGSYAQRGVLLQFRGTFSANICLPVMSETWIFFLYLTRGIVAPRKGETKTKKEMNQKHS